MANGRVKHQMLIIVTIVSRMISPFCFHWAGHLFHDLMSLSEEEKIGSSFDWE